MSFLKVFWCFAARMLDGNGRSCTIGHMGQECILWTGAVNDKGYGRVYKDGHGQYAHRVAYEEAHGEIPEGLFVLHSCDVPLCVNPDHLRTGTQADNVQDREDRGRNGMAKKEKCSKGHVFDALNTYVRPDRPGHRQCRVCMADAHRRYMQRRRERGTV